MGQALQFRRAGSDDVSLLEELEARCFARTWPAGYVAHELQLPQSEFWLAFEGDVAAGFLHFWTLPDEVSLLSMAVVPEARQRGFGRALMEFLELRSVAIGCAQLQLEVRVGNAEARSLYSACDYLEVGRRKGYYNDTGEDAVLMSKTLDTCGMEE